MAGIYLHIPFCRKACVYCDFHFITSLKAKSQMVEAIKRELYLRQDYLPIHSPLETVYFGGGTPSVLTPEEIEQLLETIRQTYGIAPEAEITLEANPDDLSAEFVQSLADLGINRLSVGTQSFRDEDLAWMNRSHRGDQAISSIQHAQAAGIHNLTIDLILGLPNMDLDIWKAQVEQAIALDIPHLSIYALTVEHRTALHHQVQHDKIQLPEDSLAEQQYLWAHERLTEAGYDHYELSNYAKPGMYSRHNSAYWRGVPYLGVGPSAHSYDGNGRSWNVANNARYLKLLEAGDSPVEESEVLTDRDAYHEYIMTQFRKRSGVDLSQIAMWGLKDWENRFNQEISRFVASNWMVRTSTGYALTPKGWWMSDLIIREFFLD
ncbi:radical SAM family heme chaperone HemW [Pontibacter sp. G13]|uniref:radical SAM family heme chaperone HemW n=1 Tax=Pontibacter sp. G13 TaxID=3074898 RepID=UPI0028891138|nr:radical SAM family heme chaperone HemW [Pontibacter sp. G13]WNJ20978.1 radical SAM family heme chaperone HemW [Pontibacter sp. G13]